MALSPEAGDAEGVVDPELRHSVHGRDDVAEAMPDALALYDALLSARGAAAVFVPPAVAAEGPWVSTELDAVGPDAPLAWHPPPGTTATGTEGRA
jgi:hypothetical protein